jgi:hypothetical protein
VRAIIPAYRESPEDVAHVARACAAADLEPFLVLQDWRGHLPPGSWEALDWPVPLGKGGAVKEAVDLLDLHARPFLVVDADLHTLDPNRLRYPARLAARGQYARPLYPKAGRLGTRLWPIAEALLDGRLDLPVDLALGGLLAPVAAYPHGRHVLETPQYGMAFDLDVLLRHLEHNPTGLAFFAAGEREHRPGSADHLDRALAEHLECLRGWVRW